MIPNLKKVWFLMMDTFPTKRKQNHGSVNVFPNFQQRTLKQRENCNSFFLFRATLRETEFESLDSEDLNLASSFVLLKFRWETLTIHFFKLLTDNSQKKFWNISWHPKSLLLLCLGKVLLIFCQFWKFEDFIKPWVFF